MTDFDPLSLALFTLIIIGILSALKRRSQL